MYTIIMNPDKSLSKTIETTLYQGESLVDKIKFLVPKTYEDSDLSSFSAYLTYIDGGNCLRHEQLELNDPDYKGSMLCYCVPVNSTLTKFAGDIKVHLTFVLDTTHILHSGNTVVQISPTDPCYHRYVGSSGGSGNGSGENTGGSSGEVGGFPVVSF